jgi:hypothetical protein
MSREIRVLKTIGCVFLRQGLMHVNIEPQLHGVWYSLAKRAGLAEKKTLRLAPVSPPRGRAGKNPNPPSPSFPSPLPLSTAVGAGRWALPMWCRLWRPDLPRVHGVAAWRVTNSGGVFWLAMVGAQPRWSWWHRRVLLAAGRRGSLSSTGWSPKRGRRRPPGRLSVVGDALLAQICALGAPSRSGKASSGTMAALLADGGVGARGGGGGDGGMPAAVWQWSFTGLIRARPFQCGPGLTWCCI